MQQCGTPTRASSSGSHNQSSMKPNAQSHWQRDIASQLHQLQSRSTATTTYSPLKAPHTSFQTRSTKNNTENINPYQASSDESDDDRPLPDITNLTHALQSPRKTPAKYFTQLHPNPSPTSPNPLHTLATLHATIAKLEQDQLDSHRTIQQLQQKAKLSQESSSLHSIQQLAQQAQQQQQSQSILVHLQQKVANLSQLLQAQSAQTTHLTHQLNTATHRSSQDTTALDSQLVLINRRLATLEKQIHDLRTVVDETVLLTERGRGWEIEEEARRQVMARASTHHDPAKAKLGRAEEDLDKTPKANAGAKGAKGKEAMVAKHWGGARTPSSVGSGSRRSVLKPGEIERLLADQAREVLLRSPIPKQSHQRRESTALPAATKESRPQTTRRSNQVIIESGSGSSSSSSASSIILAARKTQDQKARQALVEKEKERVAEMEKLRKVVHQPVAHAQQTQHLPHSRLDTTHRHIEGAGKGKSGGKNVCKICRQKRIDLHHDDAADADDEELEYLDDDLRIRSAPAKIQQSHPSAEQHRRAEQTPLERRRDPIVLPMPTRTRPAVHRRAEDREGTFENGDGNERREVAGGEKREGVRTRVTRENERKKDEWIGRLGNLEDEFLLHEKLYLEISDKHRQMALDDTRRLIIADHLKESIDSLEGKALAYLRVRVVVENEAWV